MENPLYVVIHAQKEQFRYDFMWKVSYTVRCTLCGKEWENNFLLPKEKTFDRPDVIVAHIPLCDGAPSVSITMDTILAFFRETTPVATHTPL